MSAYLWVFLTAAVVTFVVTPLVRRSVIRAGIIDQPSDRKVHPDPTPTMGGLAMYGGFLAALLLSRFLPFFADLNAASSEALAAFVGCSLMVGLGAVDDARGVRPLTKLTAQIFIAGTVVLLGVQVVWFLLPLLGSDGLFQTVVLDPDTAVVLTMAWIVFVANAVNLLDGLDGLAAGMVAIAAAVFFIYVAQTPGVFGVASQAGLLSAITAGICLGFLPWNFYPAKIFMGDTGSMLLGTLLALATISGIGRNPILPAPGDFASTFAVILVPFLIFAIAFLDVLLAVIRRTRRGVGIAHADKEHLHHRLMDIGHGHRQAVLLMYLWSLLLSLSGLAVGLIDGWFGAGIILIGAGVLFLVTAGPRLAERRRNGDDQPEEPPEDQGTNEGAEIRDIRSAR